jgi:hypothetical protein
VVDIFIAGSRRLHRMWPTSSSHVVDVFVPTTHTMLSCTTTIEEQRRGLCPAQSSA